MKFRHALFLATAFSSAPAIAQTATDHAPSEAAQPADTGGIGEIIVTAQRRSENLQNVPVAVSAVTSGTLASRGVRDIVDLKLAVPTLNLTNSNGYLTSSLRGIGSNGVGPGIENPIATYIDGVYYGSPAASLLSLNNVAQVEVLKGPQGTLFGRNATGGLIQVTTRTPTSKPTVDLSLTYQNYETLTANGYISGGTGDVAADLAVQYTHMGKGYGNNRTAGTDTYRIHHDFAARSKWILTPGDSTTITLIGDYADLRNTMNSFTTLPGTINGLVPGRGVEPDYGYGSVTDFPSYTDSASGGVSLRLDQKIGGLTLSSITAYRKFRTDINFDFDATELPLAQFNVRQRDHQFSQEFQLTSKSGGPFTWVAGAYYFNSLSQYDPFEANFFVLGLKQTIRNKQRAESLAGYVQGTYALGASTNLTLGGRYTTEKRSAFDGTVDITLLPAVVALPTTAAPDLEKTFNKFTFRASLDHRFSDEVLAYASFNRGFKSGGFNAGQPGTPAFSPEQLDAYEVGLKTDLADRRVRLNLAGFYYEYKDVQVQQLNTAGIIVINGARARVYGLDADLIVKITDGLRLTSGIGWISPKFKSFPVCPISTPQGGTPTTFGSCAGNQLPLAAKFTGNIGLDYSAPVGNGSLSLGGNLYYSSGFFPESDNAYRQPKYAQLGANVRYEFNNGLWIAAFGKNLTNKRVINFETTIPFGIHTGFFQAPRTYGLSLGFKY